MKGRKKVRAIALLSSGIDSAIAVRLMMEQDIELTAVNFVTPFSNEKKDYAGNLADQLGVRLIRVELGDDYISLIKKPKHGYGCNMNPCVDCRIYMLSEAKRIAKQVGAGFIVTGDVLGERPMSQNKSALDIEDDEAGVGGYVLRPLSARLLPQTFPEVWGWVDRSRLLALKGRSRKPQLDLGKRLGISEYRTPSGGCLLTTKEFSQKLGELFSYKDDVTVLDIKRLRLGRHFFLPSSEIIVGRNEDENRILWDCKYHNDYIFQTPDCPGPVTLLTGSKDEEAVKLAARLTAKYSDAGTEYVPVQYRMNGKRENILVEPQSGDE